MSKAGNYSDQGSIYEMVTNALAHLLAMNTDVGLKHFLPLAYDNDYSKRAIFCKATSRVMDLGGRLAPTVDAAVSARQSEIGSVSVDKNGTFAHLLTDFFLSIISL